MFLGISNTWKQRKMSPNRTDLNEIDDAIEELLDAALYLEKLKRLL
jgi:hypothetical protein